MLNEFEQLYRQYQAGRRGSGFEQLNRPRVCRHPEHNPPTHLVVPDGVRYRHVCPSCGAEAFLGGSDVSCVSHLEMSENIQSCEASIAASAAVLDSMAECLTSGREILPAHPTSPDTPRGLLRVATDGERANGRLAWVPGV